ncbi:hypothetical protein DEO72_LG2g3528 [Vigna unguiculata]|uniref:Uncharacterized protein n=1 Tax=Vigna unguiculata TaxID=3917 RepID=A0A4D6L401_VIGUN|nr:hypothetical protein DEO72_LG2g3528 [Vigna unguiculata]
MASSSNPKRMKITVGNPSKGQKRKERIYSHYFLTKDNEDRFQVVMQRKLVAERKVILKPGEEFYANAKVTTSAAPTFLSYVRGKRVPFDADMINEFLGTQLADDVECQFLVWMMRAWRLESLSKHSAWRVEDFTRARFREVPFTPWPTSGQHLCMPISPRAPMCLILRRDAPPFYTLS